MKSQNIRTQVVSRVISQSHWVGRLCLTLFYTIQFLSLNKMTIFKNAFLTKANHKGELAVLTITLVTTILPLVLLAALALINSTNAPKIFKSLPLSFISSSLTYIEWVIYPIKLIIAEYFFIRLLISESIFGITFLTFWVKCLVGLLILLDVLIVIITTQIKISNYRQIVIPEDGDYFQNGGSLFDSIYFISKFLLSMINVAIFIINYQYEIEGNVFYTYLLFLPLSIKVMVFVFYLYDEPYMNPETNLVFGALDLSLIVLSVDSLVIRPMGWSYAVFESIFLPLCLFFFFKYQKRLENSINFETGHKIGKTTIKVILCKSRRLLTPLNILEVLGSLQIHQESCKDKDCRCRKFDQLLNTISENNRLKVGQNLPKRKGTMISSIQEQQQEVEKELLEEDPSIQSSPCLLFEQDPEKSPHFHEAVYLIEDFILHQYCKQEKFSLLSLTSKLIWQLNNKIIVSEILRLITLINKKTPSFRNREQISQINIHVSKCLLAVYNKDHILNQNQKDLNSSETVHKIQENLKLVNSLPTNLTIAFEYKNLLKNLTASIKKFLTQSSEYIDMLVQNSSLSTIHNRVIKLHSLNTKIVEIYEYIDHQKVYSKFHLHVALFYMFQKECVNLHQASSSTYKEYIGRLTSIKSRSLGNSLKLTDDTLIHRSLVMLLSSQEDSLGRVLDSFGDVGLLKLKGGSEIGGLQMDDFIAEDQKEPHTKSCHNFMGNQVNGILGEALVRPVMTPSTFYFQMARLFLKLTPSLQYSYAFIMGFKFEEKSTTHMHMIVDHAMQVTGFSWSLAKLFEEPERYLNFRQPIKELNSQLYSIIETIFKENEQQQQEIRVKEDGGPIPDSGKGVKRSSQKKPSYYESKFDQEQHAMKEGQEIKKKREEEDLKRHSFKFINKDPNHETKKRVVLSLRFKPSPQTVYGQKQWKRDKNGNQKLRKDRTSELQEEVFDFVIDIQIVNYTLTDYRYCFLKMVKMENATAQSTRLVVQKIVDTTLNFEKDKHLMDDLMIEDEEVTVNSTRAHKFKVHKMTELYGDPFPANGTSNDGHKEAAYRSYSSQSSSSTRKVELMGSGGVEQESSLLKPIIVVKPQQSASLAHERSQNMYNNTSVSKFNPKNNQDPQSPKTLVQQSKTSPVNKIILGKSRFPHKPKNISSRNSKMFNSNDKKILPQFKMSSSKNEKFGVKKSQKFFQVKSNQSNFEYNNNDNKIKNNETGFIIKSLKQQKEENDSALPLKSTLNLRSSINSRTYSYEKSFRTFEANINRLFITFELRMLTLLFLSGLIVALVILYWFMVNIESTSAKFLEGINTRLLQTAQFYDYQRFYSAVLQKIALKEGIYSADRFARFDFEETRPLFNYSVSDLGVYSSSKMKEASSRIKVNEGLLTERLGENKWVRQIFFQSELAILSFEGFKLKVKNETFFKSKAQVNQILYSLPQNEQESYQLFNGTPVSADLRYLTFNTQNGISLNYLNQAIALAAEQVKTFTDLGFYSFIFMGVGGFYIVLASIGSILMILRVSSKFKSIYKTFKGLQESDISRRQIQLKVALARIVEVQNMDFYKDILPDLLIDSENGVGLSLPNNKLGKEGQKSIYKKKKGRVEVSLKNDDFYIFRLGSTFAFFILFYIIQLCLFALIIMLLVNVRYTLTWIGIRLGYSDLISSYQVMFIAYLQQITILGPQSLFFYQRSDKIMENSVKSVQDVQQFIVMIFDTSALSSYGPLEDRINHLKSNGICSYTEDLQKKQKLCDLLDSSIPNRGIQHVMMHVKDTTIDLLSLIVYKKESLKDVVNNSKWLQLEFTFENLYIEVYLQMVREIAENCNKFVKGRIQTQIIWLIIGLMLFSCSSVIFLGLALRNLVVQSKRVIFSYQLLHWKSIVKNGQVKHGLSKLFNLNNAQ